VIISIEYSESIKKNFNLVLFTDMLATKQLLQGQGNYVLLLLKNEKIYRGKFRLNCIQI